MFIKHDRKSTRLKNYDYSQNGLYFITICTFQKYRYFGNIENGIMNLNWCGNIIKNEILKTEQIRDEIKIDEYCIMPNHIHFIIEINNNIKNLDINLEKFSENINISAFCQNLDVRAFCQNAPTGNITEIKKRDLNNNFSKISPQSKSLGIIIRFIKLNTTKRINKIKPNFFKWHRNYHDHIIRNETEYLKIKYYIQNNPKMWDKDVNNLHQ